MTKFNSNQPVPFLFLGDAPDSLTGLGRIGHDLAWLVSSLPEFKVGYLGRQSFGRGKFPWTQYSFGTADQWGEQRLEAAWNDLSQGQRGVIFTVWDASRLLWFATGGQGAPELEPFLRSGRFERWGYFMVDSSGVRNGLLPGEQEHVIAQYDRALVASRFACNLAKPIRADMDWMPHPINRETFAPHPRMYGRSAWGVGDNEPVIGCVMTNQARKQWPVVFEALAILTARLPVKPRLWLRTDRMLAYWDLQALAIEYEVGAQVIYEDRPLTDSELAMRYSACDCTLVVSGGEGFCYPVAESLSCGTPAVAGDYGAQAELTPWLFTHTATYIDTLHNVRRAVYSAERVAKAVELCLAARPAREMCTELVKHLNMKELGVQWIKWFREGL